MSLAENINKRQKRFHNIEGEIKQPLSQLADKTKNVHNAVKNNAPSTADKQIGGNECHRTAITFDR